MDYFFDKTASIYTTAIVNIDWEDTKSYTAVYTSIPCDFYKPKSKYNSNIQAREFEKESLEVVFSGQRTITQGDKIVLTDSVWVDFWSYVIDSVFHYKNIYWVVDNTTLSVSQRDVVG